MEPEPSTTTSSKSKSKSKGEEELERPKPIEYEVYEHEVARLWSLTSALSESKSKKLSLDRKLQSLIQVKTESLSRLNELEDLRQKVEVQKQVLENAVLHSKLASEDAKKEEKRLSVEVRSLLVAGTSLSLSSKQLQESNRLLAGESGYDSLISVQKKLRLRQQSMVSQVSLLYPVKISAGPLEEQELESFPSSSKSGNYSGSKPVNQGSLTILGLRLTLLPFTKMSFFTDKKEVQRSATALGYAAHAVSLIGSYLGVPLRYPVRFGGSHSFTVDYAPSVEPSSSELLSSASSSRNTKHVEFPLFLEGQDTTRAAYAVFLLNKDLEQLLNYLGVQSLGPRHVLANLKELVRIIQSAEFVEA